MHPLLRVEIHLRLPAFGLGRAQSLQLSDLLSMLNKRSGYLFLQCLSVLGGLQVIHHQLRRPATLNQVVPNYR